MSSIRDAIKRVRLLLQPSVPGCEYCCDSAAGKFSIEFFKTPWDDKGEVRNFCSNRCCIKVIQDVGYLYQFCSPCSRFIRKETYDNRVIEIPHFVDAPKGGEFPFAKGEQICLCCYEDHMSEFGQRPFAVVDTVVHDSLKSQGFIVVLKNIPYITAQDPYNLSCLARSRKDQGYTVIINLTTRHLIAIGGEVIVMGEEMGECDKFATLYLRPPQQKREGEREGEEATTPKKRIKV